MNQPSQTHTESIANTQGFNPIHEQNIDEIVGRALSRQSEMYQHKIHELQLQIEQLKTENSQEKPEKNVIVQPPKTPTQQSSSHPKVKRVESVKKKAETQVGRRANFVAEGKKASHSQRARSEPPKQSSTKKLPRLSAPKSLPKAINKTPKDKKKNHQIQTADFPPDFRGVKDAMFTHIRLLWGLFEQNSVPKVTDPSVVKAFESRFSTVEEFEAHVNHPDTNVFVANADIGAIRDGRSGKIKLTKGILHIEDSDIHYIHGYLANLGIQCWGPNLEDSSESLWNSACRTGALKTFRQLAISGVYNSMSFNHKYINNSLLLIQAYNHYVHYLLNARFKNELKEDGKHGKLEMAKKNQKNRERLREKQVKFAVANDLPNRYKRIIENLLAHSDDEPNEWDEFVVNTLPYRSNSADIFFRRLDEQMRALDIARGVKSRSQKRLFPKIPEMTNLSKAPTGLPLDFYSRKWLVSLPINQQRMTVDTSSVAFLPDPMQSLWPPQNRFDDPRESWSDRKFGKSFLEDRMKTYGSDEKEVESEGGLEDDSESEEVEGGVIDLEATSPEDSGEDAYVKDDDWAKLYRDEDDDDFEPETEYEEVSEDEGREEDDYAAQGREKKGYNDQEMGYVSSED
ncbi:hypothetical protein O181_040903 [Austropuccinia psidii MF-1]|uniref:Uncharacterized protein n=1 Tax=Austropuccinia psidii MF-1 TaxID=1389203 RepID=A0A9Q3HDB5_9BASI|nr:hypothetical protein [Austropuccinia psidii MF-1]